MRKYIELALYAINNAELYRSRIEPIIKNLQRKIKRGVYDSTLAPKLWRYGADDAAQRYKKEYGGAFSVATRELTAKELADYYADHFQMKNPVRSSPYNRVAKFRRDKAKLSKYDRQIAAKKRIHALAERKENHVCVEVQRGADTWHRIAQMKDTPEMRMLAQRFAKTYKRKHRSAVVRVAAY